MASLKPPFTLQTAQQKVKAAQNLWNTCSPSDVVKAYTPTSTWRNRSLFLHGHTEITTFLTTKWAREKSYRLRKELFAFSTEGDANKIAVQFWYEWRDADDGLKWKRTYGLEHWTFAPDGRMEKRMMSGNDIEIAESERWFRDGVDVDEGEVPEGHF